MQVTSCCSLMLAEQRSVDLFKALSEPNRLAILSLLAHTGDAQGVSEVASCCDVDLSVVSRHLHVLRDAGIVEAERRGRHVRYRMKTAELVAELRALADAIESCCPEGTCSIQHSAIQGEDNG